MQKSYIFPLENKTYSVSYTKKTKVSNLKKYSNSFKYAYKKCIGVYIKDKSNVLKHRKFSEISISSSIVFPLQIKGSLKKSLNHIHK